MTTTQPTYDVFRAENRKSGREDWLGTVEADGAEQALAEAQARFECHETCHLYVREVADED